jgi:squalene monooxygenase
MWTFLGIASFTYIYKKCGAVLDYAHKELAIAIALSLFFGLVLLYTRYNKKKTLRLSRVLDLPLDFLSSLPLISNFIPKSSKVKDSNEEVPCKKVRDFPFILSEDLF